MDSSTTLLPATTLPCWSNLVSEHTESQVYKNIQIRQVTEHLFFQCWSQRTIQNAYIHRYGFSWQNQHRVSNPNIVSWDFNAYCIREKYTVAGGIIFRGTNYKSCLCVYQWLSSTFKLNLCWYAIHYKILKYKRRKATFMIKLYQFYFFNMSQILTYQEFIHITRCLDPCPFFERTS